MPESILNENAAPVSLFTHINSAHCENGATTALLVNAGITLSEPLIFGIGSGLFFSHMPFIKLQGLPVTSFRPLPGAIFRRATRLLGVRVGMRTFSSPEAAMEALDRNLAKGIPTGCLVGVFHLPYFPPHYRFHFNAHNLVVYGKEGDRYLISDPVMQHPTTLTREELARVRFAKGTAAPRGRMYWLESLPSEIPLHRAIIRGIRRNTYEMLKIPLPFFGVKGIRYLARRIRKWPEKLGARKAALNLGQVVRMQEEIGTGGAGFRYMYAAFLSEASKILNDPELKKEALEMNRIGDLWRDFAVEAARVCKNRRSQDLEKSYAALSSRLLEIAAAEESLFLRLRHRMATYPAPV